MDAKSLLKKHIDLLIPKGNFLSEKQMVDLRYTATINALNEALGVNKIPDEGEVDLFERYDLLPQEVKDILEEYEEEGDLYERCRELLEKVEKHGYTFEYGLDGIPFGLTKL